MHNNTDALSPTLEAGEINDFSVCTAFLYGFTISPYKPTTDVATGHGGQKCMAGVVKTGLTIINIGSEYLII